MIVVIPIAGGDDAFLERGYPYSKPLIEIRGKPLVERVWARLAPLAADRYVFVVRQEDVRRAHLDDVLRLMEPKAAVVQSVGATAGAACTALLAIEEIETERELIIANGDQILNCDLRLALEDFRTRDLDAGTLVFDSVHPRWSFVRLGDDGFVTEAAEKRPISRHATAGFYYFKKGGDFIKAAKSMIRKDAHVNGRFYVCPTFNELILDHAKIGVFPIARGDYISLATPQNLEEYEHSFAEARRNGP